MRLTIKLIGGIECTADLFKFNGKYKIDSLQKKEFLDAPHFDPMMFDRKLPLNLAYYEMNSVEELDETVFVPVLVRMLLRSADLEYDRGQCFGLKLSSPDVNVDFLKETGIEFTSGDRSYQLYSAMIDTSMHTSMFGTAMK